MKQLYIVRHAKSEWNIPELSDFERPLNSRGRRDAPFMGTLLASRGVKFDLLISSCAARAVQTARLIAIHSGYPLAAIRYTEDLYDTDSEAYMGVISSLEPEIEAAAIVGHNPTVTGLARTLGSYPIDNVPTCGIVGIRFDAGSWAALERGTTTLWEYPKKYPPDGRSGG